MHVTAKHLSQINAMKHSVINAITALAEREDEARRNGNSAMGDAFLARRIQLSQAAVNLRRAQTVLDQSHSLPEDLADLTLIARALRATEREVEDREQTYEAAGRMISQLSRLNRLYA